MLKQTIRNTFRSWRRTPVLAVSALLTLSLGVGFNAAVFSVVHAVLFRPLPYAASERLVELFEVEPARGGGAGRGAGAGGGRGGGRGN